MIPPIKAPAHQPPPGCTTMSHAPRGLTSQPPLPESGDREAYGHMNRHGVAGAEQQRLRLDLATTALSPWVPGSATARNSPTGTSRPGATHTKKLSAQSTTLWLVYFSLD